MKRVISALVVSFIMLSMLAGCNYSFNSDFDFVGSKGKTSQSGESSLSAADLEELKVNVGVGDVTIAKSPDQNANIKYTMKVNGSSDNIKEISDKIDIVIDTEGDKLIVEVKTNDENAQDFWQWLSNKYNNINVSVDIDIKIPGNIEIVDVNVGVGDIVIKDTAGKHNVISGVGSIKMKNTSFSDNCVITSGTGDIDMDCAIDDADSLSVQSGVGSIVMRLPQDSGFDLDAAAGVGSIKGNLITPNKDAFVGDTLKQKVNGGGTELEVTSGTGSITINKK